MLGNLHFGDLVIKSRTWGQSAGNPKKLCFKTSNWVPKGPSDRWRVYPRGDDVPAPGHAGGAALPPRGYPDIPPGRSVYGDRVPLGSQEKSFAPRVHRILGVKWGSSETLRLAIWKKEKKLLCKKQKNNESARTMNSRFCRW